MKRLSSHMMLKFAADTTEFDSRGPGPEYVRGGLDHRDITKCPKSRNIINIFRHVIISSAGNFSQLVLHQLKYSEVHRVVSKPFNLRPQADTVMSCIMSHQCVHPKCTLCDQFSFFPPEFPHWPWLFCFPTERPSSCHFVQKSHGRVRLTTIDEFDRSILYERNRCVFLFSPQTLQIVNR